MVDTTSSFRSRFSSSRRRFLTGSAALGVIGAFPAVLTGRARAAGNPTCVYSIRSLSNPYHATWNKGGAAFAKSVGADYVTLVTEGNSEKGIADIKAILAKTGGNCVINVDPNDSPDARPIVEACKDAGAYVVTQFSFAPPHRILGGRENDVGLEHMVEVGVPAGQCSFLMLCALPMNQQCCRTGTSAVTDKDDGEVRWFHDTATVRVLTTLTRPDRGSARGHGRI